MTNQQNADAGHVPEAEAPPFDPHAIEIKLVEHLDWESWHAIQDPDTGAPRGGRFLPGHEDNAPLAGIDLKIRLPDGAEQTMTTDADGLIRVEELPIGEKCAVTFEIRDAALNNAHVLFYERLTLVFPRNQPQNKATGAPYRWRLDNLMVGRRHLLSIYHPPVIIDAHMHVQSGHCAPMPMVWNKIPMMEKVRIRRSTIENLDKIIQSGVGKGTEVGLHAVARYYAARTGVGRLGDVFFIFLRPAFRKIGEKTGEGAARLFQRKTGLGLISEVQKMSTQDIARNFIASRDPDETWPKVHAAWLESASYNGRRLIMPCMVQTMDMEYAHIDGYFGIKVYNGIYDVEDIALEHPRHYWFPLHRGNRADHYTAGDQAVENEQLDTLDRDGFDRVRAASGAGRSLSGISAEPDKQSVRVTFEPCLVNDEETVLYETWVKQLKHTETAVLSHPLKLLPMFHFDPRRWQDRGVNEPFQQVENQGIYLGFKMYTAQGYRPLDGRLPVLEDFYTRCERNAVPILNHCTPKGAYTFDRKQYIWFTHPNDTDEDDRQKAKYRQWTGVPGHSTPYYLEPHAEDYFNEFFVSPEAWEPVLRRWPELHLCLAHFGGDSREGKKWADQIIEMMGTYNHLYADISSAFAERGYRRWFMRKIEKNPVLAERIVFGTDWYLTLMDKVKYPEFHQEAREILDVHDTSLWNRLTIVNPCRFYNLPYVIERLADNTITLRQKLVQIGEIDLEEFSVEEIVTAKKDAAYLREAFQTHETVEYTRETAHPN